jgi:hypothetical protein
MLEDDGGGREVCWAKSGKSKVAMLDCTEWRYTVVTLYCSNWLKHLVETLFSSQTAGSTSSSAAPSTPTTEARRPSMNACLAISHFHAIVAFL